MAQQPISLQSPSATATKPTSATFIEDKKAENPMDMTSYSPAQGQAPGCPRQPHRARAQDARTALRPCRRLRRTLEEIGKQFKVTRERIRQIEAKACASCVIRRAFVIFRASSNPTKRPA
jgi:RNA polymerase primary sigma factor